MSIFVGAMVAIKAPRITRQREYMACTTSCKNHLTWRRFAVEGPYCSHCGRLFVAIETQETVYPSWTMLLETYYPELYTDYIDMVRDYYLKNEEMLLLMSNHHSDETSFETNTKHHGCILRDTRELFERWLMAFVEQHPKVMALLDDMLQHKHITSYECVVGGVYLCFI
jgi:hypothetical protein